MSPTTGGRRPDDLRVVRPGLPANGRRDARGNRRRVLGGRGHQMFTRSLDGRWGAREAIETAVRASELQEELSRIGDPEHMTAFIRAVGEACRARGISFRGASEFRAEKGSAGQPG